MQLWYSYTTACETMCMVVVFLYAAVRQCGGGILIQQLGRQCGGGILIRQLARQCGATWYSYIYVRQLARQCGGGILIRQLVRQSGGGIHTPQLVRPRAAKLPRKLRLGSQNITTVIKLSFRSFLFCEQYCQQKNAFLTKLQRIVLYNKLENNYNAMKLFSFLNSINN